MGWLSIISGALAIAMPWIAGQSILLMVGALVIAAGIMRMIRAFQAGSLGKQDQLQNQAQQHLKWDVISCLSLILNNWLQRQQNRGLSYVKSEYDTKNRTPRNSSHRRINLI